MSAAKKTIHKLTALLLIMLLIPVHTVSAITAGDLKSIIDDSPYYNPAGENSCSSTTGFAGEANNYDYAGRLILTQEQLSVISQNKAVYEAAATANNIPWQMLAVIHLREHGLQKSNPSNGQGIYQFYDKRGGPYPTGDVTDEEFLRQTMLAAEFIKAKAGSNLEPNRTISSSGTQPDTIKDTFFSYNGRASVYADQAEKLGFDKATQPFEGSPYVMNKADAQRDPTVNTTTWGQIKQDNGPLVYPANNDYGAFVTYASIAGIKAGSCAESGSNSQIAELAMAEFAKNVKEEPLGSDSGPIVDLYTNNNHVAWCAYFVSYILKAAGKPFEEGPISYVPTMLAYANKNQLFHPKGEAGFTPQAGDIAIYNEGLDPFPSHVNIVISYNSATGKYTSVGGNESDSVQQATLDANLPALTGFMRVK